MTEELVEAVARKLYETSCMLDPIEPRQPEWGRGGYKTEVMVWQGLARAVIPIVLEEAARVAEEWNGSTADGNTFYIATAIRALAGEGE